MSEFTNGPAKAIALISGGLDSMLAAKVVIDQGVDVEGVNFYTGFCVEGHTHAIRNQDQHRPKRNNALWVAEQLGIKLHIVDIVDEYKDIVLNPKYGYGKNLNPCLDCKIFMVNKALNMESFDGSAFDFVVTGEVIGQRPKSQRKETMPVIARESGAEDRLLRPLCARNLPQTLPERNGWVSRHEMYGFSGRNRKPQIALAERFGFTDYAQPAGGCCFLTNANYSRKLADLWNARNSRNYELDDIILLKVGRHLRPSSRYKLILSRDEGENRFLQGYRGEFVYLETTSCKGPVTLLDGDPTSEDLETACRVVSRYSQGRNAAKVSITVHQPDGVKKDFVVTPFEPHQIPEGWHIGANAA